MEPELNERENTARDYMRGIFRRRGIIAATCAVTLMFVAIGLALKTKTYDAQVKMLIQAHKTIESPYYRNISDFRPSEISMTQSEIVRSNPVIERVVKRLSLDKLPLDHEKQFASPLKDIVIDIKTAKILKKTSKMGPQEQEEFLFRNAVRDLKKRIKVEPVRDTDLFAISASAFTPKDAARIANVVSRSYCIFDLEQQLAELKQQYGDKHLSVVQLQNNIDKLEKNLTGRSLPNIEAIGPASVKIIEQAVEPAEPAGRSKVLILILSFFASIIFGTVLAFSFDYFDTTLKSPKEIKAFLAMPYLGYVPHVSSVSGNSIVFMKRAVNAAAVLSCAIIVIYVVLTMFGVDPANPIFMFISIVSLPVASLTSRVPLGGFIVPLFLITIIVVANTFITHALNLLEKQALKSSTSPRDLKKQNQYIQAFRNLTHQLYLVLKGNEHRSVLVTSALAGEGVSTVLANLARYLAASSGKKVLLIDANTRDPNVHKLFRLDNKRGLTDILEADASLNDAVHEAQEGLFILTSGAAARNTLELPDSTMFSKLIEQAEKRYEIVLIDCPNLKDYSDSVSLSAYVSGIILVVSEGMARREVLKASLAGLEQKKANFIGVIFNNRTFAIPNAIYERA